VKVKLLQRWGQYPPATELDMHDELAKTLVRAKMASLVETQPEPRAAEIETAEAPQPVETAARVGRPRSRKHREATP